MLCFTVFFLGNFNGTLISNIIWARWNTFYDLEADTRSHPEGRFISMTSNPCFFDSYRRYLLVQKFQITKNPVNNVCMWVNLCSEISFLFVL